VIEPLAITDRPERPLPVGLEQVRHGGLAGVFVRPGERPPRASPDALWRHERFVEELMRDRAVLPLRYGTGLAGEQVLKAAMTERANEFEELLDLVRGRVELAVRVLDDGPRDRPAPESRSGRDYMESLARRRSRAERARATLEPLEGVALAARRRESSGDDLIRWAFLVERDAVERFRARLDELRASHPELRMTCTGPWPPYSFVSGGQ
jgi:hypothetical protein